MSREWNWFWHRSPRLTSTETTQKDCTCTFSGVVTEQARHRVTIKRFIDGLYAIRGRFTHGDAQDCAHPVLINYALNNWWTHEYEGYNHELQPAHSLSLPGEWSQGKCVEVLPAELLEALRTPEITAAATWAPTDRSNLQTHTHSYLITILRSVWNSVSPSFSVERQVESLSFSFLSFFLFFLSFSFFFFYIQ